MTELTSEELRAACEMAGLEVGPQNFVHVPSRSSNVRMRLTHPALPAYVAELLVGKVVRDGVVTIQVGESMVGQTTVIIETDPAAPGGPQLLSKAIGENQTHTTIRAAMAVLA